MIGRHGDRPSVSDEDLRGMLEARAGSVRPDAGRDVRIVVHEALRVPRGGGGFSVLPVSVTGGGSRQPAGWAAAVMVAVLAIAVLGGRLGSGPAAETAAPSGSPSVPPSQASEPVTAAVDRSPLRLLSAQAFGDALSSGALQGQVVVVRGRLRNQPAFCAGRSTAPCLVAIDGLTGVQVLPADTMDASDWEPAVERSVGQAFAVRVAQSGRLLFLGYLRNDPVEPISADRISPVVPAADEVVVVAGRLVNEADGHRLTAPVNGGVASVPVDVSADSGLRRTGTIGPIRFLVRGHAGSLGIVGAIDASTPSVTFPDQIVTSSFEPWSPSESPTLAVVDPAGLAGTSTTMEGLRAGILDGSLDGSIVIVAGQLRVQPLPCPSPAPVDCFGLQLRSLDGIEVSHAGVTSADVGAHIGVGPIAFRVAGNQLSLLGWLTHGSARPVTVVELLSPEGRPGQGEVAGVAGWLTGRDAAACPDLRLLSQLAQCPDGVVALTSRPPNPDGTPVLGSAIATVEVDPGLALPRSGTGGPFLVAPAPGDGLQVPDLRIVARLDASRLVLVDPGELFNGQP